MLMVSDKDTAAGLGADDQISSRSINQMCGTVCMSEGDIYTQPTGSEGGVTMMEEDMSRVEVSAAVMSNKKCVHIITTTITRTTNSKFHLLLT